MVVYWSILLSVSKKLLQIDLGGEALLGFLTGNKQGRFVVVPITEALEILSTAFIIQDERHDFVAEALFEHQESADATVTILEGMNPFKSNVEVQDLEQFDFFQTFILSQQCTQLRVDILRRSGLHFAQGAGFLPILAGMDSILSDIHCSFGEQLMEMLDVGLSQRLRGCLNDIVDTGEVVIRFDQIIDFDRFEAHMDLACLENLFHLRPHEPVTGHAVITVAEVDLDIVIQAMIYTLSLLLLQLLHHGRQNYRLIVLPIRLFNVIGNEPNTILLDSIRHATFPAKTPNKLSCNLPSGCSFVCI